jgi:acetate kinase
VSRIDPSKYTIVMHETRVLCRNISFTAASSARMANSSPVRHLAGAPRKLGARNLAHRQHFPDIPMSTILTVNVGSSSIKLALFDGETRRAAGGFARVSDGSWEFRWAAVPPRRERVDGIEAAVQWVVAVLEEEGVLTGCDAIGHRIVHGGPHYTAPVWITNKVLAALDRIVPLAPDHLPGALQAIRLIAKYTKGVRQAACFDTAFHKSLPDVARLFGISRALADAGVVRYGFHGLSCEYIVGELNHFAALGPRTIIAHLGHGSSLTAVRHGRSIDTTMGLTPTGGVVMDTRSGDLDPGVLLYLMREREMGPDAISKAVNEEGGLFGIAGAGDIRVLLERGARDARAALALEMYCYHIRKSIGALTVTLGGLDTLVFTAGIGEHAAEIRAAIANGLAHLGVWVDPTRNVAHARVISPWHAPVTVHVMATNEELTIARHVRQLL